VEGLTTVSTSRLPTRLRWLDDPRVRQIAVAVLLAIVGGTLVVGSLGLEFVGPNGPGPGFLPTWVGGLLFAINVIYIIRVLRTRAPVAVSEASVAAPDRDAVAGVVPVGADEDAIEWTPPESGDEEEVTVRPVIITVGLLIVAIIASTFVGLLPALWVAGVLDLRVAERMNWPRSLLFATGLVIFMHVVFEVLLGVRLLRGSLFSY
jgi:hypothetical protein